MINYILFASKPKMYFQDNVWDECEDLYIDHPRVFLPIKGGHFYHTSYIDLAPLV